MKVTTTIKIACLCCVLSMSKDEALSGIVEFIRDVVEHERGANRVYLLRCAAAQYRSLTH